MKIDKTFLGFVMFVGIACGVFFVICLMFACCGGIGKLSEMGSAFNMLSALFAGLAFAAICSQLRMQQTQIDAERLGRQRAERISALTTSIQVNFQKIVFERKLLLQVAPGFATISFLHDEDAKNTKHSIDVKEDFVKTLGELIEQIQASNCLRGPGLQVDENLKELWNNQAALAMLKHIKKWVDQMNLYEKEMDELLSLTATDERNSK